MKLRIKGNSLRLRVTRSELKCLIAGEDVEEIISFGPAPEASLPYTLVSRSQDTSVNVHYLPQKVTVTHSPEQLRMWSDETQVGVYINLHFGVAGSLEMAVEKDFAFLDRSDKDNADTFANPHAEQAC
ncbi:MAG: hypothetical protein ABI197_05870 [Granulicella sp.]